MSFRLESLEELDANVIHVWHVFMPEVKASLDRLKQVLNDEERLKADRFRIGKDHDLSVAARGILRLLLERYTGIPAAELRFGLTKSRKPFLDVEGTDVEFNVSHSDVWVLLAFGRGRRVGVDVEKVRHDLDVESIVSRFFTPEEADFIRRARNRHETFCRLWVRKEAYVKALGTGLFRALNSFSIPVSETKIPDLGMVDGWIFHALEIAPGYAAAVVTDRSIKRVECYKWES